MTYFKDIKTYVASAGYVGLSIATLLSQYHQAVSELKGNGR